MTKYKLGFIEINIDDIVPCDWNYKENDDVLAEKLKNNIKRNGQIENIIVYLLDTGFYCIANGNHRYTTLKELDYKKIMCYNLGKISLAHAQRIAIETNETRFNTDNIQLADLIKNISLEFDVTDLINTLPYSELEIDNFSKLTSFDWEQFNNTDSSTNNSSSNNSTSDDNSNDYVSDKDNENQVVINLSPESFALWQDVKEKFLSIEGIENESHIFEIIVNEAFKIPDKKLQKIANELTISDNQEN